MTAQTETVGSNEAAFSLDPAVTFPSLEQAMTAYAEAMRVYEPLKVAYDLAIGNLRPTNEAQLAAEKARDDADCLYCIAQKARNDLNELYEEHEAWKRQLAEYFEQLKQAALGCGDETAERVRHGMTEARRNMDRLAEAGAAEGRRVCAMIEMEPDPEFPFVIPPAVLLQFGQIRHKAGSKVARAKANTTAAYNVLLAATKSMQDAADTANIRMQQLMATAVDSSIPHSA